MTTMENEEMLKHVEGALLACRTAIKEKGNEAGTVVDRNVDIRTVGDIAARDALVEYFKKSGLPVVLYTEELEKPLRLSLEPSYSVVADEVDATTNMSIGMGMLPHGSIVGIAKTPNPKFEDFVCSGFLEFNSGNLFYAVQGQGAFLVEGWANGRKVAKRLKTSGKRSFAQVETVILDSYVLGSLDKFFRELAPGSVDHRCSAIHYAMVASGAHDLFILGDNCTNTKKLKTGEEIGPLYLLIREAGGAVLDWNGSNIAHEEVGLGTKKRTMLLLQQQKNLAKNLQNE